MSEDKSIEKTINYMREIIEGAHMAGQCDAGIDPSYSNAQLYANKVIPNENERSEFKEE